MHKVKNRNQKDKKILLKYYYFKYFLSKLLKK